MGGGMKQIILLSYPYSGNTWCRYIIERVFKIRTYGYESKIDLAPMLYLIIGFQRYRRGVCVLKRHNSLEYFRGDEPLIFLRRDKQDAISGQIKKREGEEYEKEKMLWQINEGLYSTWQGAKTMITYDELMGDVPSVIHKISHLTGIAVSRDAVDEFMKDLDEHIQTSLSVYCGIIKRESRTYGINLRSDMDGTKEMLR
jgi:hypothetical protein